MHLAKARYISPKCRSYTLPAFCNFVFPPCTSDGEKPRPKKLCSEECELLKQEVCYNEYADRNKNPLLKASCNTLNLFEVFSIIFCYSLSYKGATRGWAKGTKTLR